MLLIRFVFISFGGAVPFLNHTALLELVDAVSLLLVGSGILVLVTSALVLLGTEHAVRVLSIGHLEFNVVFIAVLLELEVF